MTTVKSDSKDRGYQPKATRNTRCQDSPSKIETFRKQRKLTVDAPPGGYKIDPEQDDSNTSGSLNLFKAVAYLMDEDSDMSEREEEEDSQGQETETVAMAHDEAPHENRIVRQVKRIHNETLTPHPTNPDMVIATFQFEHPNGTGVETQVDHIPEIPLVSTGAQLSQEIWPDAVAAKVPRRIRARRGKPEIEWVKNAALGCWERISSVREEFRIQVIFRRLDPITYEYIAVHTNTEKLRNADPNDKQWMYGYNKWIDQINRRNNTAYTPQVSRLHWSNAEIRALLTGVNAYCHAQGIDRFGCKGSPMKDSDFQVIADAVNVVGGKDRNVDAVRGQVNTAHAKKLKPLMELRELAAEMRSWIENGGVVSDAERRPPNAIALSEFPM